MRSYYRIIFAAVVIFVLLIVVRNIKNDPSETNQRVVNLDTSPAPTCDEEWRSSVRTSSLEEVRFMHQGVKRSYYVYVPSHVEGCTDNTLLVALHGGEGSGDKIAHATGLVEAAEVESFILVLPNSHDTQWNDGREVSDSNFDDVAFITSLINELTANNRVADNKVFVMGVSNGGMMAQRLLCDAPGTFAGAAIISANLPRAAQDACNDYEPTPIVFFAGTADKIMPYTGGEIASLPALGIGAGGVVLSAPDTELYWQTKNMCPGAPVEATLGNTTPSDGTTVNVRTYAGCAAGAELKIYTIVGGGHNWPGSNAARTFVSGNISQTVDATTETVSFFTQYGF